MTHIDAIGSNLEQQLDDLIKNADKEEDKERFKALKVFAKYYKPSRISHSVNFFTDGTYDLIIEFTGCH